LGGRLCGLRACGWRRWRRRRNLWGCRRLGCWLIICSRRLGAAGIACGSRNGVLQNSGNAVVFSSGIGRRRASWGPLGIGGGCRGGWRWRCRACLGLWRGSRGGNRLFKVGVGRRLVRSCLRRRRLCRGSGLLRISCLRRLGRCVGSRRRCCRGAILRHGIIGRGGRRRPWRFSRWGLGNRCTGGFTRCWCWLRRRRCLGSGLSGRGGIASDNVSEVSWLLGASRQGGRCSGTSRRGTRCRGGRRCPASSGGVRRGSRGSCRSGGG
jgi:hypothetical protein